jgi:hypothetical protein
LTSAALQLEIPLDIAGVNESVTVTEDVAQVETSDTKLGQVIGGKQVAGLPLNGLSYTLFSSGAERERLDDYKCALRLDLNFDKKGTLYFYYFADRYGLNNPYPSGFGGATVPSFNALSNALTQLLVLSHTKSFGPTAVNEARISGTSGNSARRPFYGPGMDNYDLALHKITRFTESRTQEIRFETSNTFNHAQFFGANSVDGNVNSATFGYVMHAAPQRISQIAAKVTF